MKSILITLFFLAGLGRLSGNPDGPGNFMNSSGTVLISEVLYDPEPAVGLPQYEFVEWYNAGDDTVDLSGWMWVVGDKVRLLQSGKIAPGSFLIVCSPAAASAFMDFGSVLAMESFPALRNSGDRLTLLDPDGQVIHTVDYSPVWFTDALKANGGWSLELTDFRQYCNPAAWLPSVDPAGGTPGKINSQQITVPPAEPSGLIRAAGYTDEYFVLLFSGMLKTDAGMNNYSCSLMPGGIVAQPGTSPEYGFPGLFFRFPEELDHNTVYTLELNGKLVDCAGQNALTRPVSLGFPSLPDSADVVITEVMFDPLPGQTEFIEVFNRSEHMVDLKDLIVARGDTEGKVTGFSDQQDLSYWLFPGCYAIFTSDARLFLHGWPLADRAIIAVRPDLPALTNGEVQLMLMDRNQKLLDRVVYSPDWHYPYLDDDKGVSLERIDPGASGTDRANWFSAPAACGGSSPGLENSSLQNGAIVSDQVFVIDPAYGYSAGSTAPANITVRFNFGSAGWFLRVRIFNEKGLPVKEVFPFGLAPVEGVLSWDGLDSGLRMVPEGIYLIVADYYLPTGKKGRWKRACPVVRNY